MPGEVAAMVEGIRASDRFVDELSLVEEDDHGRVVGHVIVSYVDLARTRVLQLGPVGVLPELQNLGIGSRLIEAALARAEEMREPLVLVLGHPTYYPRFGFETAEEHGIRPPRPAKPGAFMVRRLTAYTPALRGTVAYPPAFV